MAWLQKLETLEKRFMEIERLMAQPEVAADYARLQGLSKERASLEEVVSLCGEYKKARAELEEAQSLLKEGQDTELATLAKEEIQRLETHIKELEQQLRRTLLPKDANDERDVIVEIRGGTGGTEAALFAADLYRMYTRYAQSRGWAVQVLYQSEAELGGFKEIIFEVRGKGAFSQLKYERGVHRVQRIPVTEASGRIHTSTATVAVLPEADEVEEKVNPEDLRIDIFHASGHGGQNVQKVATAVRIVHVPTGISAVCQDERSQLKNRQKAMAILRARLYEMEREKREQVITESRRAQVGTAERAEKVRTYNYPQDRMTDHRIGLTVHGLERILGGDLDEIIDALAADEEAKKLAEAVA